MSTTALDTGPAPKRLSSRIPPLLRERTFRRYWSAQSISMFGDQISSIALPLTAVLVLHARAAQMGLLTAAIWLPSLLFAVHAGIWADRFGRRRVIMIAADLGRAVLLTSVPAGYALHVLTLAQLYGVAFGAGTLSILFTVSDSSLSVKVMPPDQYVEGNSLVYASRAFSFVGGPSLGGLLVQLFTAPFAIAADALSFLGSAFFLSRIRPAEAPPDRGGKGSLTAGARFINGSQIVRASLLSVSVINFFNFVFFALLVLYATRALHVRPGVLGLVLGAGAVGGVIGSLSTTKLAGRIGIGWAYTLGALMFTVPVVCWPLAGGPKPLVLGLLFLAEFLTGFGVMLLDISIGAIFAVVIPDGLRSRVSGAFQAVNYGTRPIGALAGGTLGTLIGLRPTLWIATVGGVIGAASLLASPLPRFRMPTAGGSG
ncbi:MAG TPA: MFS transporter [Streptosporangiaceae bacterium]|nr:MFS transporter [Streptosporangiaceae bacterium]